MSPDIPAAVPERTGRLLHTGQAVVDVVLRIPSVPEPGGDVFASSHDLAAGGGVNTMTAAARDGARVVHLGSHGTGPFGDLVRSALSAEGIEVLAAPTPDRDTGFSVALVDDSTERTFVSTSGAEARAPLPQLLAGAPVAGDVVCVSGYSLVHPVNREALREWLPTLGAEVQVVVDPSPMIGELDLSDVRALLARADVWSTNEREARLLTARLAAADGPAGAEEHSDADLETLAARLCTLAGTVVVLRAGAHGVVLARPGRDVLPLPAPTVTAVDTNGAGDAHTGVLCARLAAGEELEPALRRAGVAAAIAVTRHGPATAPTAAETDHMLDELYNRSSS
jgi:sugar/nucleoside kinase (ribokinase family)